MNPSLSVIIPALNEALTLPLLLDDLKVQNGVQLQIIVADGGSTDETPGVADSAGVVLIDSSPGRARQMNAGGTAAKHDWLLFLHADSRLTDPSHLARAVAAISEAPADTAGHFSLRFAGPDTNRLLYRFMAAKTRLNRRECFNGDQGLLIGRRFLEKLGGFDSSLPFLEDQRIGAEIHEHGRWITLPGELTTDTRRFVRNGPRRQWLLMVLIMGAFGAPVPEFLDRTPALYPRHDQRGTLKLAPFFRLYWRIMRERGMHGTLQGWAGLGAFATRHIWQLFLFCDIGTAPLRRSPAHYPMLQLYDRRLENLLQNRPVRAIAALSVATLMFALVWPAVELYEASRRLGS